MIKEAIILAGGQGKRLRPLTDNVPKPMVQVNGRPVIDYKIEHLRKYGVEKIIIACGYRWEKIKEKYGDSVIYSVENEPLDTGGAIKLALKHIKGKEFFVANCDDLVETDLRALEKMGPNAIVVGHERCRFGVVDLDGDKILGFRQKPILPEWVSVGLYLLKSDIPLPDKGAIETFTFPKLQLKAFRDEGRWLTINTAKDLEDVEKELRERPFDF